MPIEPEIAKRLHSQFYPKGVPPNPVDPGLLRRVNELGNTGRHTATEIASFLPGTDRHFVELVARRFGLRLASERGMGKNEEIVKPFVYMRKVMNMPLEEAARRLNVSSHTTYRWNRRFVQRSSRGNIEWKNRSSARAHPDRELMRKMLLLRDVSTDAPLYSLRFLARLFTADVDAVRTANNYPPRYQEAGGTREGKIG